MKLLERLNAIYHILRYRNYILITGIKEFVDYNNKKARRMKVLQRTDYKGDSDEVTCMALTGKAIAVRYFSDMTEEEQIEYINTKLLKQDKIENVDDKSTVKSNSTGLPKNKHK